MMTEIEAKQEERRIVAIILRLWEKERRPITIREVADASGHGIATIFYYKDKMVEHGFIEIHNRQIYPPGLYQKLQETVDRFFDEEI